MSGFDYSLICHLMSEYIIEHSIRGGDDDSICPVDEQDECVVSVMNALEKMKEWHLG